jgi:hypothetical protein
MTQFTLGPIVGGISATEANIWGRTDGPGQLYAWLGRQADLSDAWLAGESPPLAAADGFAGVARHFCRRADFPYRSTAGVV